jgi:Ca2+-binding EF-hand superfamily protein
MLSAFRRAKLAHQFRIYDTNADGVLERTDLLRVADALAEARGHEPGSAPYESLAAHYEALWAPLQRRSGGSLRARVTLEAFLLWHEEVLADLASYDKTLGAMAGLLFDVFDEDSDGVVHLAEYERFARATGIPGTPASWFPRLDLDGDGRLTRDEVRALAEQFYFSDDPHAPGNWFFGALRNQESGTRN